MRELKKSNLWRVHLHLWCSSLLSHFTWGSKKKGESRKGKGKVSCSIKWKNFSYTHLNLWWNRKDLKYVKNRENSLKWKRRTRSIVDWKWGWDFIISEWTSHFGLECWMLNFNLKTFQIKWEDSENQFWVLFSMSPVRMRFVIRCSSSRWFSIVLIITFNWLSQV